MSTHETRRILVIDDNPDIHADYKKILCPQATQNASLVDAKAAFFGKSAARNVELPYEIEAAHQGKDALEMVKRGLEQRKPYALAFVDVRMPPGWDGVETISRLWEADPDLQCVICTAFADYSWEDMIAKLGRSDRLLILKKPFDPIEVCQLASALTEKWCSTRRERERLEEVRRAEQEARAYSASLITMNRALEAARARAESALEAKSEALASMSQEIRTPLLAILGYADVLRADELGSDQRIENAGMIHEHGESLLAILSDLFDLASIETQRLAIARCPMEPVALVQEVLCAAAPRAAAKTLELELECQGPVPSRIHTDPARLRQILHHLIGNAIKFTPEGSVRVVLGLDTSIDGDPSLRISVIDTGVGIRPELQGRLFEAFASLDSQLIREHGGAGLGLVLSKRLSQLLGGDLVVDSTPGKGSVFTCTIKTGDLDGTPMLEHPRAPIPSSPTIEPEVVLRLDGARILLVEDVPTTYKLFRNFLESAGAGVEVAENGRDGVDVALAASGRGEAFDVILMDIQLPVLDGYAATGELRSAGYKNPIVAVTAYSMSGDREKCLAAGCDDYASKPLGRKTLVELCRQQMIGGPRSPSAGRQSR